MTKFSKSRSAKIQTFVHGIRDSSVAKFILERSEGLLQNDNQSNCHSERPTGAKNLKITTMKMQDILGS